MKYLYSFLQLRRAAALVILLTFAARSLLPIPAVYAQSFLSSLPAPGNMLPLSRGFQPVLIKGMTIHPENPFQFDFILDGGQADLSGEDLKEESTKLIKYFLAALTVPEDDQWVNLSPYEKDRIIPDGFGETEMGRDLLAQDYMLKQITASLLYPEDDLGKEFWERIYKKAYETYGTMEVAVSTFNKVWVMPDFAEVYENGDTALLLGCRLKVMTEYDYLAESRADEKSLGRLGLKTANLTEKGKANESLSNDIIRDLVIPQVEKEINEGKNFAQLRQIYHSLILATWFKRNLKESVLGQVYVGKNKIDGVDVDDKQVKEKIYEQYLEAYKNGVFSYIKEEYNPVNKQMIPRKYFSGGKNFTGKAVDNAMMITREQTPKVKSKLLEYAKTGLILVVAGLLSPALGSEEGQLAVLQPTAAIAGQKVPSAIQQRQKHMLYNPDGSVMLGDREPGIAYNPPLSNFNLLQDKVHGGNGDAQMIALAGFKVIRIYLGDPAQFEALAPISREIYEQYGIKTKAIFSPYFLRAMDPKDSERIQKLTQSFVEHLGKHPWVYIQLGNEDHYNLEGQEYAGESPIPLSLNEYYAYYDRVADMLKTELSKRGIKNKPVLLGVGIDILGDDWDQRLSRHVERIKGLRNIDGVTANSFLPTPFLYKYLARYLTARLDMPVVFGEFGWSRFSNNDWLRTNWVQQTKFNRGAWDQIRGSIHEGTLAGGFLFAFYDKIFNAFSNHDREYGIRKALKNFTLSQAGYYDSTHNSMLDIDVLSNLNPEDAFKEAVLYPAKYAPFLKNFIKNRFDLALAQQEKKKQALARARDEGRRLSDENHKQWRDLNQVGAAVYLLTRDALIREDWQEMERYYHIMADQLSLVQIYWAPGVFWSPIGNINNEIELIKKSSDPHTVRELDRIVGMSAQVDEFLPIEDRTRSRAGKVDTEDQLAVLQPPAVMAGQKVPSAIQQRQKHMLYNPDGSVMLGDREPGIAYNPPNNNFKFLLDRARGGNEDALMIALSGFKVIRVYLGHPREFDELGTVAREIFEQYGIKTKAIFSPFFLEAIEKQDKGKMAQLVDSYIEKLGQHPWVYIQLGNEDYYYLKGREFAGEKGISLTLEEYYAYYDRVSGLLKDSLRQRGVRNKPVLLGLGVDLNGSDWDVSLTPQITNITAMKNIDGVSVNAYLASPHLYDKLAAYLAGRVHLPVVYGEFGRSRHNSSADTQSAFNKGAWENIQKGIASGAAAGGFVFSFYDKKEGEEAPGSSEAYKSYDRQFGLRVALNGMQFSRGGYYDFEKDRDTLIDINLLDEAAALQYAADNIEVYSDYLKDYINRYADSAADEQKEKQHVLSNARQEGRNLTDEEINSWHYLNRVGAAIYYLGRDALYKEDWRNLEKYFQKLSSPCSLSEIFYGPGTFWSPLQNLRNEIDVIKKVSSPETKQILEQITSTVSDKSPDQAMMGEINSFQLAKGATVLSPIEKDVFNKMVARKKSFIVRHDRNGVFAEITTAEEQGYSVTSTDFFQIDSMFREAGVDVVGDVLSRLNENPDREIVLFADGVGEGEELKGLVAALKKEMKSLDLDISKIKIFGISAIYFKEWENADPMITFILDDRDNVPNYFSKRQIDVYMSHKGISHIGQEAEYINYMRKIKPLLKFHAIVVHDYYYGNKNFVEDMLVKNGFSVKREKLDSSPGVDVFVLSPLDFEKDFPVEGSENANKEVRKLPYTNNFEGGTFPITSDYQRLGAYVSRKNEELNVYIKDDEFVLINSAGQYVGQAKFVFTGDGYAEVDYFRISEVFKGQGYLYDLFDAFFSYLDELGVGGITLTDVINPFLLYVISHVYGGLHQVSAKDERKAMVIGHRKPGGKMPVQLLGEFAKKYFSPGVGNDVLLLSLDIMNTYPKDGVLVYVHSDYIIKTHENLKLKQRVSAAQKRYVVDDEVLKSQRHKVTRLQEVRADKFGGIDFNPDKLEIRSRSGGVQVNVPRIDIRQLNSPDFTGFTPVIIEIIPVTNLPLLIGAGEEDAESMVLSRL